MHDNDKGSCNCLHPVVKSRGMVYGRVLGNAGLASVFPGTVSEHIWNRCAVQQLLRTPVKLWRYSSRNQSVCLCYLKKKNVLFSSFYYCPVVTIDVSC